MSKKISVFDTTLRDGEQGEGIAFTVHDKLKITAILDGLGVHYIEGGWPGSNPKAIEYFNEVQKNKPKFSKIAAFGSTRRAGKTAKDDPNLNALIAANPDTCVIFGKTWDFHATHALKISLEENLAMISDSVAYLKSHNKEVIFDAEHFFDGYKNNPEYALQAVLAAQDAGADILCLCDTNGGTMPEEAANIIAQIKPKLSADLGIHTHNDSGLGVAVALAAIDAGAVHVQGTLNGYGERCGNANLASIIANLVLKKGIQCISNDQLKKLKSSCQKVHAIANMTPPNDQPYVGKSAFAHKGGIHVSAILKRPETYEHIMPELVGNKQRVLVSDLSGGSNINYKAEEYGITHNDPEKVKALLQILKDKENEGYQFESAEASFELLLKERLGDYQRSLTISKFQVNNIKEGAAASIIEATMDAIVDGKPATGSGKGNGPVSALDKALRRLLAATHPLINDVHLQDYKVRVLSAEHHTDAKVRVFIVSSNGSHTWTTIGVSENIIDASCQALLDSYEFAIFKHQEGPQQ
ncbi:MAG: citramalate synthase [bacterium]|nr:citramalate synthase [bacterium]